jgi:hypothetical protein
LILVIKDEFRYKLLSKNNLEEFIICNIYFFINSIFTNLLIGVRSPYVSKLAPLEGKFIRTQQEITASQKENEKQVKKQRKLIVIKSITQSKLSFFLMPKIVP